MDQDQQSRWRPTRRRLLWAAGIVSLAFLGVVVCGYLFGWTWTGLPKRTFWDWLDLLIIPVVLAVGGFLFTRSENRATQAASERRAQDEALQAYLDQVGQLLLDKDAPLRQSEEDSEVRTLARARTLTVLSRLDGDHKAQVVQFVYEAGLIDRWNHVLSLSGADLSRADLSGTGLRGANLSRADLRGANLIGTDLYKADLIMANLGGAYLGWAELSEANLSGANMYEANLTRTRLHGSNLYEADLRGADLGGADLGGADLREADLSEADLSGANVYEEVWLDTKSLLHATMPNGQKYEDWLKDKENGKNE